MRFQLATLALSAALAATAGAEESAPLTTRQLADGCQVYIDILEREADRKYGTADAAAAAKRGVQAGTCIGFIQGFLGGYSYGAHRQLQKFCLPKTVTPAQLARMMVKAARAKPEFDHQPAITLMIGMTLAFPCPGSALPGPGSG